MPAHDIVDNRTEKLVDHLNQILETSELLDYAIARLGKCPFGEKKPTCAQCTIHCYQPAMRVRARAVMKHSGPRMLTTHPILAARHIAHGIRHGGHNPQKVFKST